MSSPRDKAEPVRAVAAGPAASESSETAAGRASQASWLGRESFVGGLPELDEAEIQSALARTVGAPLSAPAAGGQRKSIAEVAKNWEAGRRDFRTGRTQVFESKPRLSGAHANFEQVESHTPLPGKVEWVAFQELLRKPQADAGRILARAVKRLSARDASRPSGSQELRQLRSLAADFRNAPPATQVQFIKHVHGGLVALPSDEKAEVMRLVAMMAQAAGFAAGAAPQDDGLSGETVQLLQEAAEAIAKEARVGDLDSEQQLTLRKTIEEVDSRSLGSAPVAAVGPAVDHASRSIAPAHDSHAPEPIAPSSAVPLNADVSSGLGTALRVADIAKSQAWVLLALPAFELVLAAALGQRRCGNYLVAWLVWDALLGLALALLAYLATRLLEPAYEKLRADPARVSQRWHDWWQGGVRELTLESHGVERESFRLVVAALLVCFVFLLIGTFWALFGLLELTVAFLSICVGIHFFIAASFMAARLAVPVGLAFFALRPGDAEKGSKASSSSVRFEEAKSR